MSLSLLSVLIRSEHDVVAARQRARDLAALLGFDIHDQTRIATAVSEIARNAFLYAGGGKAEFSISTADDHQAFAVCISDSGPGIPELKRVLRGQYRSQTGMGMGILGAQRLADSFRIDSSAAGTTVWIEKTIPGNVILTPERIARVIEELSRQQPRDLLDELRRENQELLQAMQELRRRQEELARLNSELEDTNRGVVALYAELDERAETLRRTDQMKSRFLSHMSHEFRTPLTSILALCRLLQDQTDGKLTPEQQKQMAYIRKSAESLLDMVNDLLDLAKVEAGKTDVRPVEVQVSSLFGALRGVMRPLLTNNAVALIFEEPVGVPPLCTDESKLAQILRNFVSNALKFTERGEVRVSARLAGDDVVFSVSDTGIGIAPEHRQFVFQEFTQVASPVQSRVRGTGLGLPLARKLAELLGGRVGLESRPGEGSTFSAIIPRVYAPRAEDLPARTTAPRRILIIDDEEVARYLIKQSLNAPEVTVSEATDGRDGLARARSEHPDLIFLDLRMPGKNGFEVLHELKSDNRTRDIPVIVITSKTLDSLDPEESRLLLAHTVAVLSKDLLSQEGAPLEIGAALAKAGSSPAPAVH
jgi:signal transduction histidine kinase